MSYLFVTNKNLFPRLSSAGHEQGAEDEPVTRDMYCPLQVMSKVQRTLEFLVQNQCPRNLRTEIIQWYFRVYGLAFSFFPSFSFYCPWLALKSSSGAQKTFSFFFFLFFSFLFFSLCSHMVCSFFSFLLFFRTRFHEDHHDEGVAKQEMINSLPHNLQASKRDLLSK